MAIFTLWLIAVVATIKLRAFELLMEHHLFDLNGKLSDLGWALRRLELLEQSQECVVGGIRGGDSVAFIPLRPPGLNRLACALAPLLRGEFSGPCRTTSLPALPPESYGGRVLSCSLCRHMSTIRERSRIMPKIKKPPGILDHLMKRYRQGRRREKRSNDDS